MEEIQKKPFDKMDKKLILAGLYVIISSLVSSIFVFDLLFGFNSEELFLTIAKLSIIFIISYIILWVGYSKLISNLFKKNFISVLIKDSKTYLPFIILAFFPLKYLVSNLGSKFMQFSYIPSAMLFTFAFSLFVLFKVYFLEIKIDNKKSLRNVVFIIIIIFFIAFSALSVLKHFSFFSTGYDLGIYDQAMYGYSKGKMYASLLGGIHLLEFHLEWIMFIILPIYMMFSSPVSLLVIQALFICLGAYILYLISKDVLKNEIASVMICITYFMYHAVHYTILFDFHPAVLSIPFIFLLLYSLINRKYKLLVLSLFVVVLCKEYLALIAIPVGIFLFFSKKRTLGVSTALAGLFWFIISVSIVIPFFHKGGGYFYIEMNPQFGSSIGEIFVNLLTNPMIFIKFISTFNKLAYLILFSIPVFFGIFALLAPEFLFLGITELAILLLINKESLSQIVFHHQIALVPFIMVATIIGIKRLSKIIKSRKIIIACSSAVLSASVLSLIFVGPFSILYDLNDFNINKPYVRAGHEIIKIIPKDASVTAPNWIVPHLSQREKIYLLRHYLSGPGNNTLGIVVPDTDFIIADMSDAFTDPARAAQFPEDKLTDLFNKKEYGIIAVKDTWVLLKKGADYEESICKIKPFLNKSKYPYLDIRIYDSDVLKKC